MLNEPIKFYPVTERFNTFQGEGVHMGRSAFFIRTYGCPVKCPWCDSAGTWHPQYVPDHITKLNVDELVAEVKEAQPLIVVVTGGEPAAHDLDPLVRGLHEYPIHLETSGALPIRGNFSWITLSPKKWRMPLAENVLAASEFKLIIETPEDIRFYTDFIVDIEMSNRRIDEGRPMSPIWLHPEWSQRDNKEVLAAISNAVKQDKTYRFRAGWQLHKLYRVDALDPRSAPLVPLGGNPEKGF